MRTHSLRVDYAAPHHDLSELCSTRNIIISLGFSGFPGAVPLAVTAFWVLAGTVGSVAIGRQPVGAP